MAFVLNDRVKETTTTTGTGAVTLGGTATGFQTFAAGIGNSNTCYYAIVHQTANEWETGLGTLNGDSSTLTRTAVYESTNSDSAEDFASGTKDVFCTLPASKTPSQILTTANDLIYANSANTPARLAAGTGNQVLKMNATATAIAWAADSAGVSLSGTTDNTVTTVTGADAIQGEANLTFDGSTLAVTGAITSTTTATIGTDLTVTGADITLGNASASTVKNEATAHNTAGKTMTITSGTPTAGTTSDIAGGSLTLQGGQGKGTGAGGDIIFQTANASTSAATLNSYATALTLSDDLSATFGGVTDIKSGAIITASQAANDLFYANSATAMARLAKGTGSQILAMNATATAIEWADAGGGGVDFQGFKVTLSANQSIPEAAITQVEYDTETYDIGSNFDTGTYEASITADSGVDQYWYFYCSQDLAFTGTNKGDVSSIYLYQDATTIVGTQYLDCLNTFEYEYTNWNVSGLAKIAGGTSDNFRVYVFQTNAGSSVAKNARTGGESFFGGFLVNTVG
jgi:hypothetical protein